MLNVKAFSRNDTSMLTRIRFEFSLNDNLYSFNYRNCNALKQLLSKLSQLKVKMYKTSATYIGEFV